jgi:hypothetical protein
MLPFLHDRVQRLDSLLVLANATLVLFNQRELGVNASVHGLLDKAIDIYRALGRASTENELLTLKAQFVLAESGTNPLTSERISTYRRDMVRATIFRVLQQGTLLIRTDAAKDQETLADAVDQMRPIVLMAIQKRMITIEKTRAINQSELDALWQSFLNDPEIELAAKQMAMRLNLYDIQLVLGDLLIQLSGDSLKSP